MNGFQSPFVPGLPRFTGGAVGYLGYDTATWFEPPPPTRTPARPSDDDAGFMLFDTVLAFDHVQHRILLIANARISGDEDLKSLYQFACAKIEFLERELERALSLTRPGSAPPLAFSSNMTQETYEAIVKTAKEYIAAGDIYQVVLSQRFEAEIGADAFTVYRALRHVNPSPYMFFIRMGDRSIVGSSPEMLVRVEGRHAITHPIAGTRPRGKSDEEDHASRRGAEAQREGEGRARDARRSRPQRHRPRLRLRHGARADVHDARALLARDAPGVGRRGHSSPRIAIGSTRWCRASRPARCRARRRCARCRSSTSSSRRGAASTPARSATSISPATWTSASPSARSCSKTARPTSRPAPASSPTRIRRRSTKRRATRRAR